MRSTPLLAVATGVFGVCASLGVSYPTAGSAAVYRSTRYIFPAHPILAQPESKHGVNLRHAPRPSNRCEGKGSNRSGALFYALHPTGHNRGGHTMSKSPSGTIPHFYSCRNPAAGYHVAATSTTCSIYSTFTVYKRPKRRCADNTMSVTSPQEGCLLCPVFFYVKAYLSISPQACGQRNILSFSPQASGRSTIYISLHKSMDRDNFG